MARLGILAALLLLASCEQPAADGYSFGTPTWVRTELRVKVVLVPSLEELRRIGPKVEGRELHAFAQISPTGECTIYKVDSRKHYAPEWDGHELNHCIYGEWHR
ncbi:MAG: hypothetical protein H2049_00365 [Porphyrobacter sp.]|nr:hypothetical protein [Porphyrobacter sp.]